MSKLQEMPVLDRMYPGATMKVVSHNTIHDRNVTPDFFRNLTEFKRFKLDENLRVPTPKGAWEPEKIFGHLMLPFPKVWIEWENRREDPNGTPPWWMAAACVHKTEVNRFIAELFGGKVTIPHEQIPESPMTNNMMSGSWVMLLFELTTGIPRLLPGQLTIHLDEKGMFQGVDGSGLQVGERDDEMMTAAWVDLGWDALAAIGMLNCRNVTTEGHDRSKNVKKRRRPNRDRSATLNFHTINLPGTGGAGEVGKRTETIAMHMARGHFKTFTEEAPLFGKYTGTYWWGWQVRGNRKNGEVVSDYRMSNS